MRIAVLTDSLADTDGVGRYTVRLMAAVQRARPGTEIVVALARKHPGISSAVPRDWRIRIALPPDYFFYVSKPRFHAYTVASVARILPMLAGVDIVHATKDYPHSYVALTAARLARKPCVMTAHGTYSVVPLTDPRHAARARAAYPRFGRIVCVSEYTRKRIEERISLTNLEVIRNAVDADHYVPRPGVPPRPWHGTLYTLGIGALKERKGHRVAIEGFLRVAAAHPALVHYVVGAFDPSDPYFRGLQATVRAAGCADRVRFLGNVEEDVKVDLMQHAFAFVHAPIEAADGGFEGFGIVYLEASASGVPSIGTRGSGAEDAVVDGTTGFLVPPEPQAVAQALGRLLAEPELRRRMGEQARAYARTQTWDANARSLLRIYDGLIDG